MPPRASGWVLVAALAAAPLAGCSSAGDDDPPPGPTASPSASAPAGRTVQQVNDQYLAALEQAPAVATVAGTLRRNEGGTATATLEIVQVAAGPDSTVLRLRLRTDQVVAVSLNTLSTRSQPTYRASGVVLESAGTDQKLTVGRFEQVAADSTTAGRVPRTVSPRGVEVSALFAALDPAATQVKVKVPGFPAVTAPVERS